MILATPIFFPAIMKLGYDPLCAGIITCLTVLIGCIVSPVAMNVFAVRNITKVPLGAIYRGCLSFSGLTGAVGGSSLHVSADCTFSSEQAYETAAEISLYSTFRFLLPFLCE